MSSKAAAFPSMPASRIADGSAILSAHENEKSWRIAIRATQAHRLRLQTLAEVSGTSVSAVLRQLVEHASVTVYPAANMKLWSEMGPLVGSLWLMRRDAASGKHQDLLTAIDRCTGEVKALRKELCGGLVKEVDHG